MRFYRCEVCGKIVAMVKNSGVPTVCCGQPMRQLAPSFQDGSRELHMPVYSVEQGYIAIMIGSRPHPMTDMHRIEWIAVETSLGCHCRLLTPGMLPEAVFGLVGGEKTIAVFAYCNVHGLYAQMALQ